MIYVATLGRLASRDTVSYDRSLTAIEESLKKFGSNLSETDRQAFGASISTGINIAQSLLNLIGDRLRHEKLKPIIICKNNDLVKYIGDLQKQIDLFYLNGVLQDEKDQINVYSETVYNMTMRKFKNNPTRLNNELAVLEVDYKQWNQKVQENKEAALAYLAILEQTSQTHQALFNTFKEDLTSEEQSTFCTSYFPKPQERSSASMSTPEQCKQAEKIMIDYAKKIKSLSKQLEQN
jgi:hypothetical protein